MSCLDCEVNRDLGCLMVGIESVDLRPQLRSCEQSKKECIQLTKGDREP